MRGPKFMPWMESIVRSFEILFLNFVIGLAGGFLIGFGLAFENENVQIVFVAFGIFILLGASCSAIIKIIADSVSYALYHSNQNTTAVVSPTNYGTRSQSQTPSSDRSQTIPQFGETRRPNSGLCGTCGHQNSRGNIRCSNCSEVLPR